MNRQTQPEARIPNLRVPAALVSNPAAFGGASEQGYLRGDLIVRNGVAAGLAPASDPDGAPRMVLPRLTEVHVHLDKCHTVDRMPAVGGDLRAAIDAQSADKANWTEEDIRARALRGLGELIASGCGLVRSHVDWSHGEDAQTPPLAWHVLKEQAQEARHKIDLQLSPLVSPDDLLSPGTGDVVAREVATAGGALGAFVLDQPNRKQAIETAFRLADRHGIALDFHVDEGLAEGLDGLSLIAQTMIETRFDGPVLCGHACSLMNWTGDALERVLDRLTQAGLTVAALPTTNLYLQGRANGTPDRRGLTRLRELRAAGVAITVGTDNVRDAFCPVGQHDPRAALSLAVLAGHLDPPLAELWPLITINAQRALGAKPTFVDGAPIEKLVISQAPSSSELLAGTATLDPLIHHLKGNVT